MKFESFLTLHRQQWNYHIHIVTCDISGSTVMVWSYENAFCVQRNKNKDFIQQFLLFRVSLRRAFKRVPQRMRVVLLMQEPDVLRLVYKQRKTHAEHETVFRNMSEDFDREDDLTYLNDELREMDVLHQNASSCISSTARMRRGTAWRRLTKKRIHFWRTNLFSLRTESIHVAS